MKKSTSEVNQLKGTREIPSILCKPNAQYCIHKRATTVALLSQLDPVHSPTCYFLKIHRIIIFPSTPVSHKWSLSLTFPHQEPEYASLLPIRATCPTHLTLSHFITRKILGEQYRS